jgi:hypothetical protein
MPRVRVVDEGSHEPTVFVSKKMWSAIQEYKQMLKSAIKRALNKKSIHRVDHDLDVPTPERRVSVSIDMNRELGDGMTCQRCHMDAPNCTGRLHAMGDQNSHLGSNVVYVHPVTSASQEMQLDSRNLELIFDAVGTPNMKAFLKSKA